MDSHPLSFANQVADLVHFISARDAEKQAERARTEAKYARWRKYAARAKPGSEGMEDGAAKKIIDSMEPERGYQRRELKTATNLSEARFSRAMSQLLQSGAIHQDYALRTLRYYRNLA